MTSTPGTPPPLPPPQSLTNPTSTIHVELTHSPLSIPFATQFTRSPTSGATVLFLGTTRSFFRDPANPVSRLTYTAYPALALRTLLRLASEVRQKHGLERVCVVHRLGEVGVGEESIVVAVGSAHRGAAWRGAEELLERVKESAEIWKREWFVDGSGGEGRDGEDVTAGGKGGMGQEEVGVWRANRESDGTGRVKEGQDGG